MSASKHSNDSDHRRNGAEVFESFAGFPNVSRIESTVYYREEANRHTVHLYLSRRGYAKTRRQLESVLF